MHLGLSSLFGLMRKRSNFGLKKNLRRQGRTLVAERLESRYALVGDLADLTMPLPLLPLPLDTTPANELPPGIPPLPLETPPPGPGGMNPTSGGNTTPSILDFNCLLEGQWLTVSGRVVDNQDPSGYVVHVSGLLNIFVTVGGDDLFSYRVAFNPEFQGTIFAVTQDYQGLMSAQVWYTL